MTDVAAPAISLNAFCDAHVEIPLTRGYVAVVDKCDLHLVDGKKWIAACTKSGIVYASHSVRSNGTRRHLLMHRVITNAPKGTLVDHWDGNGLNNRRDNLRFATYRQNAANCRPYRKSSSRFKGVYYHKSTGMWAASIRGPERPLWLGYFAVEEDAARIYDAKALELFGQFARLNFPILPSHAEALG